MLFTKRSALLITTAAFLLIACPAPSAQDATRLAELHNMMPMESHDTWAVALADVDNDGDMDLFYGGHWEELHLALNNGAGLMADAPANLPKLELATRSLALGDVDSDGDIDLAVGNRNQPTALFLNDGLGNFSDASNQMPSHKDPTEKIVLVDVDSDGDLDLVKGNLGQNSLYLNDGWGVFSDATNNLPSNNNQTMSLFPGDVDSDGDIDLVEGNDGQNSLYLNDGSGFFSDAANQLPAADDITEDLALGDINSDGHLDLVTGNDYGYNASCQTRLYLNDGTGKFFDATAQIPVDDDCTRAITLHDVDRDGDLDLHLGNYFSYSIPTARDRLYLNDGTGILTESSERIPGDDDWTRSVAFADMDGDGDSDLVLGNDGQNRLFLNNGTGFFDDVTAPLGVGGHDCRAVALGDLDNDGDLDILAGFTHYIGCQNRLFLNDGSGQFIDATMRLPVCSNETRSLALGDLDNDGDLDAFEGNNGRDALYLNDGTGTFIDASYQIPGFVDESSCAALGDVDDDGDLDIMVSGDRLYLNDGNAVFSDATVRLVPPSYRSRSIALADVDGDGDLDAMMAKWLQNSLYLNNGAGVFIETAAQMPLDSDDSNSIAMGDVDGDGDLDAFFGNESTQNRLYLNNGLGGFTDASAQIPAIESNTEAVCLVDLDDDGDLDAIIGNSYYGNEADLLHANDGTGIFTDVSYLLPGQDDDTYAFAAGDLDLDGDNDLVLGNLDQPRIYSNLARQIAWRALPRPGRELTIDINGPAGGFFRLAVSSRRCKDPRPPLGILLIDPAYILWEQSGFLNSSGRASVILQVPTSSILLGRSLYWQAALGPDLSLSNLEITTFSGL